MFGNFNRPISQTPVVQMALYNLHNGKHKLMEGNLEATAGSYCTFNSQAIWKAKTEGKHRFFAWLLVQGRIQTADVLLPKGVQCNPICCLCDQEPEIAAHLCLHCCFAQEVWWQVHLWSDGLICTPSPSVDVEEWWNSSLRGSKWWKQGSDSGNLDLYFLECVERAKPSYLPGDFTIPGTDPQSDQIKNGHSKTIVRGKSHLNTLMYFLVKSLSMLFIYVITTIVWTRILLLLIWSGSAPALC